MPPWEVNNSTTVKGVPSSAKNVTGVAKKNATASHTGNTWVLNVLNMALKLLDSEGQPKSHKGEDDLGDYPHMLKPLSIG